MGLTRFQNGLTTNEPDGIFASQPNGNPMVLWEELFDFSLKIDINGGDNQWSTFGDGSIEYPLMAWGIIELDAEAQPLIELPPSRFVERPGLGIEEQRIVGRIDLNITGAKTHQLHHLVPQDGDHIREEALQGGINRGGVLR